MADTRTTQLFQASVDPTAFRLRWVALLWITLAELFVMSVWFSASAVIPELMKAWHVTGSGIVWLTSAVQLGFVIGALTSATIGLPDRIRPRLLMGWGAFGAASTTGAILLFPNGGIAPFFLRAVTGGFLAIVYPVAVQWVTSWFPRQRGISVGILIGGLTIGSALPHLLAGFSFFTHWQWIIGGSAGLAFVGWGLVLWVVPESPHRFQSPPFHWGSVGAVFRDRPVMLANLGYWGHMWELYAMWTWLPSFLFASWRGVNNLPDLGQWVGIASFVAIGVTGMLGALVGGRIADRFGRTATTIAALTISGAMSLLIGLTYRQNMWFTIVVILLWGFSVIADSAQFSVAVTELSPPERIGSALTVQMALGFFLTIGSINLIGSIVRVVGFAHVFSFLAIGPIVAIIAMMKLRGNSASNRMANGKK